MKINRVNDVCGGQRPAAITALAACGGHRKTAIVMLLANVTAGPAKQRLNDNDGFIRQALANAERQSWQK